MTESYGNYVDGEWIESTTGETFEVRNPANTDEVVGTFQRSNAEDAEQAVEAAVSAQDEWANTPGPNRGAILNAAAQRLEDRTEELTETLTREEGKTLAESRAEVQRAVNVFYYYAQKAADYGGTVKQSSSRDSRLYTVREPLGVAALITPWNYPIAIPSWKMAPALATGNTVVFKPAKYAPHVTQKVIECLDAVGLPDGVVNYVTGPGEEVGGTLTQHEDIDIISFTGSRQVGKSVYEQATAGGKRAQTEMGSKNPSVVMPSADLDEAVEIVGSGAFGVTGQACTATSRALVHEDIYEEFVEELVDYAASLQIGAGLEEPDMGPKVSQSELENTLEYIEVGKQEGATIEYGGDTPDGDNYENGYFVEPTIFTDVEPDMRIMQEEIFGPVVGVMAVSDFDEAVDVANDVEFGLSAGIVTRDHTEANRYIDEAEYGVVKVNEKTTGLELHVPFGGLKASSSETFREQGDAAIDFYTITKTVYENYEPSEEQPPAVDAE